MQISAVDVFCGAGGLSYGLERAGIDVQAGLDIDRHSAYPYEANTEAKFRTVDIRPLARDPEPIKRMFPWNADMEVLAACAPCQPYSTLSNERDKSTEDHDRWGLLNHFKRIVEEVEPDVVITENVLQVRHDETYVEFEDRLTELGYTLNDPTNRNVYAPEYGIPQNRKRWVLIASKEGKINLPEPFYTDPTEYPTAEDAIGHLPPLEAGAVHPSNDLHRAQSFSEKNLERIRNMNPGEDWRVWEEKGLDHLLADCHKRESGRSYKAPYSRMVPDEPAPTITTQFYNYGSGRFGHFDTEQNRALSLLEGALLQTFPEDYDFFEDWERAGFKNVGRLIGNAVPPKLGRIIGEAIGDHVGTKRAESAGVLGND